MLDIKNARSTAASAPPPPPPETAAATPETATPADTCHDCVDRAHTANMFAGELDDGAGAGKDPTLVPGDATTYSKVEGDAFRTDGAGKTVDPTHGDVDQGDLGDCWLMAGAAAVAHTDPERIRGMITERDDGTFDVRLGGETINVKPTFPDAGYADPTPGNQADTLWPALIEKAYAQKMGGYDKLDHGNSGDALQAITGHANVQTSISTSTDADALYATLKAGKDGDHPMTYETKDSGVSEPLKADHAYAILDVYERDGQKYAKVYNPWGVNDGGRALSDLEHEVKVEDLVASGSRVTVNGG